MSEGTKAVFLSYASQDAEAAKRICDALRAAGVEVWFDQSELVGGDAWDAKIRRQIGSCGLFMPIISASTQARAEGYFRLEWRLADKRTELMGKSKAFLLPVCIDDTRDGDADVPDSFTAIQWTRLKGGETPPAFVARVQKLLGGGIDPVGGVLHPDSVERSGYKTPPAKKRIWPLVLIPVVMLFVAGGGLMLKRYRDEPPATPKPHPVASTPAALSPAQELVAKARIILEQGDELNRETYALAEELLVKAEQLDVTEASAWVTHAKVSAALFGYGLDRSSARREALRSQAARALQLAPSSIDAQLATFDVFITFSQDIPNAILRLQALAEQHPGEWRIQELLSQCYRLTGELEKSLAANERALQLSPDAPRLEANRINLLVVSGRWAEAETTIGTLLQGRSGARLLAHQVYLKLMWSGDLAGAAAAVQSWPGWFPLEDRGAGHAALAALWNRDPESALQVMRRFPRDYVRDFLFTGPSTVLSAWAHEQAGNAESARADWRIVQQVAERELRAAPDDQLALHWKAWALARLGDTAAAGGILQQLLENERSGPSLDAMGQVLGRWGGLALVAGRTDLALVQLELKGRPGARAITRSNLRLNPVFDPLRDNPRFQELIKTAMGPAEKPEVKAPDPKSIVVLPFTNLSGDKEQEYFSDGLTEEILNALARERDLRVVPRASAFSFKGKNLPLPEIARVLSVAQVVDGTVRRAGNVVRIDCTITRVAGEFTESLPRFEKEMKNAGDIFALQDEVAGAVVERLTQRKAIVARAAVVTQVPAAYDAYLQGRQLLTETSPSWRRAVTALDQAVKLDSRFALAWASLGRAHAQLYSLASSTTAQSLHVPAGRAAVETALRLQPNLAEAHLAQALLLSGDGTNLAAALQELDLAEQSRPDSSDIILVRAQIAIQQGQRSAAIDLTRRAASLDPRNGVIANQLGNFLRMDGRYGEAGKAYELAFGILGSSIPLTNQALNVLQWHGDGARVTRLLEAVPMELRTPGYWTARQFTLYELGDLRGSLAAFEAAAGTSGPSLLIAARAREELGERAEAEQLYRAALIVAEKSRVEMPTALRSWSLLALTYAGLGRKDEALAAANKCRALVPPAENPYLVSGGISIAPYLGDVALAQVLARFGMTEEALAIVQAQADAGWWRRHYLLISPDWNLLRKDPRFRAIAEKAPL